MELYKRGTRCIPELRVRLQFPSLIRLITSGWEYVTRNYSYKINISAFGDNATIILLSDRSQITDVAHTRDFHDKTEAHIK